MIINGKDNVLSWFDTVPANHWIIYAYEKSDSGFLVLRSTEDDQLTKEASRDELSKALSLLSGRFTICAMPGIKRSAKGDYKINMELEKAGANVGNAFTPPQQGLQGPAVDVQAEIKKALDKYKAEQKLEELQKQVDELKKENKELEKSANDPFNELIKIAGPYIPHLLGNQAPAVAGINDAAPTIHQTTNDMPAEEVFMSDAEHERLSEVVRTFMAADPQWLETLEKMAAKVKANPSVLNTLKAFL